jgi:hypothetical protein
MHEKTLRKWQEEIRFIKTMRQLLKALGISKDEKEFDSVLYGISGDARSKSISKKY